MANFPNMSSGRMYVIYSHRSPQGKSGVGLPSAVLDLKYNVIWREGLTLFNLPTRTNTMIIFFTTVVRDGYIADMKARTYGTSGTIKRTLSAYHIVFSPRTPAVH